MKNYVKPSLKELGPLRVVTKFSCPAGEFYVPSVGRCVHTG